MAIEEVVQMFADGFNCAQTVASLLRDISGVDEKTALAAMGGFGGGMKCKEVCGAVSGGVYTLSMYCPIVEGSNPDTKKKLTELVKEFTSAFNDEFGTLICRELLSETDRNQCYAYVARATELVKEIVERDKTNGNL